MIGLRIPRGRAGTTLTEVLMALLVMGLGLSGVIVLFPLSMLRSVEASKLTHATLLRQNAEARLNTAFWIDANGNVISNAIVQDPNRNGNVAEHDGTRFVFDPLGAVVMSSDGTAPPIGNNMTAFGDSNGDDISDAIPRFTFGLNTLNDAERFVTLPDSYTAVADLVVGPGGATVSGTTLTTTDPNLFADILNQPVRVTLFDPGRRTNLVREGQIAGQQVRATAPNTIDFRQALPVGFEPGRVLIDLPERRYTWLATVRRVGATPSVTIVVFFRRNFSPDDERIWQCQKPAGSYNEFFYPNVNNAPPGLRVGGWMFDVGTFRWWKIVSIQRRAGGIFIYTDPEEQDSMGTGRLHNVMFPRNVVDAYTVRKD